MPDKEVINTKGMEQLWNKQQVLHESGIAGCRFRDCVLQDV